jgi:DNA invertase Pin-like site-specific DNA recombinase
MAKLALKVIAVLYMRMSKAEQDKSIEEQRESLLALAEQKGYHVYREYVDAGISGDETERRTHFLQMREDASKGEFSIVLCWDQDRFGRFDQLDAGYWIYPFRQAGVCLETIAQGKIDWDDFAGRMIYSIQQEAKHQFLRDLARNSLRGLIKRAKTGVWVAGRPPFGFNLGEDEHLALGDPLKVAAVREAFRLRLLRLGYRAIARALNSQEMVSPSGGKWSHDAVRIVLGREAYCGVSTFGGRRQGKYFTMSDGQILCVRPGEKLNEIAIRVDDAHPAIIDRQTWAEAQAVKVGVPRPHCRRGGPGAPLAGLLYCKRCGHVMYAQSLQRKGGQKNPRYVCSTYHKGRGCGYCVVPQDAVLAAVANAIRQDVLQGSPERLEEVITAAINKQSNHALAELDKRASRKKIAALDKQIEQATDRLISVDSSLVPDVEKRLLALKRDRATLAEGLKRQPPAQPDVDPKEVAQELWRLGDALERSDPAEVRQFLSRIVSRIELEFQPGKRHGRGQKYEFVRGTVKICPKACPPPRKVR